MSENSSGDKIRFVDFYQTPLNAGTYEVKATLTPPEALQPAFPDAIKTDGGLKQVCTKAQFHVAGPRSFLPPSEVHSVFPPENGEGDYNNVLPHVVLNRRTLPWERLVDGVSEDIPFLALLVFSEDEEADGDVTPPTVRSLEDLGYPLEPGEKLTDKVSVIDVKRSLLEEIIPTGEELRLLAHARERIEHTGNGDIEHQRAVVIANRLPASPPKDPASPPADQEPMRNIAHLVMLENRYGYHAGEFTFATKSDDPVRLVCLKSWQFTCSDDKPTLRGRLLGKSFTFDMFCVPKKDSGGKAFEPIRAMSYAALPYHLRYGDRTHTLYHGPLVAAQASDADLGNEAPASADGLVRILEDQRIFDVSLAAAWQLGLLLMLRDQSVAMEYFTWRRRDAQHRAQENEWAKDGHLHLGDDHRTGLSAMPSGVRDWCAERLELRGLPFEYLVPDARMLPEHSLRVFRIQDCWMECLLSGALAVGRSGEDDRRLEAEYRSMVFPNSARDRTGFLLRSPAVDEHPDLVVGAFQDADAQAPLTEVRLERVGPGLLLGLYSGTISKLEFSLPPIGLHFGLKEKEKNEDGGSAKDVKKEFDKDVKNEENGDEPQEIGTVEQVRLRGERVVEIKDLRDRIGKVLVENGLPGDLTPGRFAFQMCEGTELVEFGVR